MEQQPRLLVHSRPLLAFLGGLLCASPAASRTCLAVPRWPLPLLALGGQVPSIPVADAGGHPRPGPAPQPAGAVGTALRRISVPREPRLQIPPGQGMGMGGTMGKKRSGSSWRIPMESEVGTGACGPIVLAFPAPLPCTLQG